MSDKVNGNRKKRIWVLKRIILLSFLAAVSIPIVICVFLVTRMRSLEMQMAQMQQSAAAEETSEEAAAPQSEEARHDEAEEAAPPAQDELENLTEEDSIREWENEQEQNPAPSTPPPGIRKVYLTFDDGPSIYTDDILDILQQYDVKATFFVVADGKEGYEDAYRRILEEGHTLGMHSYSHVYKEIYSSKEAFIMDVNRLQDYIHEITGEYPEVYRFPGGSSNHTSRTDMQELKNYLDEIGIVWYDWNISGGDATGHLTKSQIVSNCTANLKNFGEAVILLHDAGDKRSTVEALPEIIETILAMENTVILPITKDTVPVQHGNTGS